MPAQMPTILSAATLATAAHGRVAALLGASVPAIVVGGDGRTLRFLNAAAAIVAGICDALPLLGQPAPLDEAVLKHLHRVVAAGAEMPSNERIRYYRGIKPIILSLTIEPLGLIANEPAVLVTMPELARPNADASLEATLALYAGHDALLTIFGDDDVLAVAGRHAAIDEAAPGEIEAIVERAASDDVNAAYVRTGAGRRAVHLLHIAGDTRARRLLYIGPLEQSAQLEQSAETPSPELAIGTEMPQAAADATIGPILMNHDIEPQTPTLDADTASPGIEGADCDAGVGQAHRDAARLAGSGPSSVAPAPAFQFNRSARPVRFTWELDRSDRFAGISPEFAEQLGQHATPLIGESWDDAVRRFVIDTDEVIAKLLHTRQAWHGRTIHWPVEGQALRVPIDFTAMPLNDADGHFGGLRGFGVIRSSLAEPDPLETGLGLSAPIEPMPADGAEPSVELEVASDPVVLTPPVGAEQVVLEAPDDEPVPPQPHFRPLAREQRFPRLVQPPDDSDDHFIRQSPTAYISPETLRLSGAERNAFRQIAEALGARFEGDDEAARPVAEVKPPEDEPVRILSAQQLLDRLNAPPAPPPDDLPPGSAALLPYAGWRRPEPFGATELIDRMPLAVALIQGEAIFHLNPAFLTLTGYVDVADLNLAGGLSAIFAGPHASKGWSTDRYRHHIPIVAKSGQVMPVDARIASVPWSGGTALLLTLIAADRPGTSGGSTADAATATLRETLGATQERVRELDVILSAATDGILTLNADGRILSANAAAETLFGFSSGALVGERLLDLLTADNRRTAGHYIEAVMRNGIGSQLSEGCELNAQALPDRIVPIVMMIARLSSGETPKLAAVLRDVSRWKASEEELRIAKRRAEEASLQKSDFLVKISHEIRTPLNAIIGFSEVMLGERFGAIGVERYKDYLRDIQSSGTHIMSLVNDLLDLSKVEAGKLDLKFESVQLVDILSECVHLMQPQANRERIIIRASLTQGLPPVVADARSIRQIVLNLLSNAIKFTPAGGQVIVSAALEDTNEVVIRVRDTGYGMSAGDIEIAMEPFRQVHNSRGRNSGPGAGTGLGLPLTKALVEANRAALKIDSAVNQGTLVQVTFPAPSVLAAE
jgi:PAS domain S-box-containing protein